MFYHFHMFRRLRKILPSALLLKMYESFAKAYIYHGLSIWGFTRKASHNRLQRFLKLLARITCDNFDDIHSHGIDLGRSLKLLVVRERRDHVLSVSMLKCIHCLLPP